MHIKKLLKGFIVDIKNNHRINGLKNNSQDVKENDVFFAIKGEKDDGYYYINQAIKKGAKTIICEKKGQEREGINYFVVEDILYIQAYLAKRFFHNITKKVKLIGITGTNGKTTISTLLADYLEYTGKRVLLIGTNGIRNHDISYKTGNTTPDILLTLSSIKEALKRKTRWVVMEVSSHAIKELRVWGFNFKVGAFSNLTHDHLDYHKTLDDYIYTKGVFLSKVKREVILNRDSPYYLLYSRLTNAKVTSYAINNKATYQAQNIFKSIENGTSFEMIHGNEKKMVQTSLIGEFNVSNILAVVAILGAWRLSIDDFLSFLKFYVKISGRMEMITIKGRTFIIDYAHTPDGILNVCQNIKEYTNSRLIVVVGCGGNRDTLKRPIIGDIATRYADHVIFTNDNPRDEAEEDIVNHILAGVEKNNYEVIYNREKAIMKAISLSSPKEIIAILGKGCENEQIIKGIKYPFNDLEVVKKIMKRV